MSPWKGHKLGLDLCSKAKYSKDEKWPEQKFWGGWALGQIGGQEGDHGGGNSDDKGRQPYVSAFKKIAGTSLAVQWLRLGTFKARVWIWSLVGKLRFCLPCSMVRKLKKKKRRRKKRLLCATCTAHWKNMMAEEAIDPGWRCWWLGIEWDRCAEIQGIFRKYHTEMNSMSSGGE